MTDTINIAVKLKDINLLDTVYHKDIYDGNEPMTVVGTRVEGLNNKKEFVLLEGDYSGGTYNVTQRDWHSTDGLIIKKVDIRKRAFGDNGTNDIIGAFL